MKHKTSLFFFILILCSCTSLKKMTLIMSSNPHTKDLEASAKRGAIIFDQVCMGCHGLIKENRTPSELGVEPAPNLYFIAQKKSAAAIAANIKYGKGDLMPPFEENLSDSDIWDAANFIYSFKTKSK